MSKTILPNNKLTVIIRDDTPLLFAGDTPGYRSVQIELTDEQVKQIQLKHTGNNYGQPLYEQISHCFIEPLVEERAND